MGWRPPPGAPAAAEGGDPADPDLRAWPKTCAFTASPELWRALRVRARAENISVTALIRRTLQREFLPPRKREPEPPLNEAHDRREAAGVVRFLSRSAVPATEPIEESH